MSRSINPYYSAAKLGLEQLEFDRSSGSYEYDTIVFWATKDGRIYTASDSGCSCPTPFEGYSGDDLDDILQGLERIGSVEQAEATFDSWRGKSEYVHDSDRKQLSDWIKEHLKS